MYMTQKDYISLVDRSKRLSYEYYVLVKPTVSDAEFDALVAEIEQAESEHPEWTLADSPTQMVGSDVDPKNGRRLIRHRTRMLSCQKAQTQEAVTKWMQTSEKKLKGEQVYAISWKLDGISCSLVYMDGYLTEASSRGEKGVMGQDLTDHVHMMTSVPQTINLSGRVEVRGEIICPKANLAALGYKDCRTAAAALCNQVRPSQDMERLSFVAWQIDTAGTEDMSMRMASELGFKTCGLVTCNREDVLTQLDDFSARRETLEWPTDGVVVKINDKAVAASLGATEHHPKGSIAYKFSAQKTVTRVISIEISIGEKGGRTPVAHLEPVTIMGREISSASLYSERIWKELGVTEGCLVEVGLTNDVTPKIYRVIDFPSPNDRLNENDLNKLDNLSSDSMSVCSDGQAVDVETTPTVFPTDEELTATGEQGATEQCAVTFLPIGATLQPEPIIEAEAHPVPAIEAEEPFVMQPEVPRMSSRERNAEQRRRRREQREAQQRSYEAQLEREAREADEAAREEERRKIYAAVGAAAVTLVLIYFFGLLEPAVFGLLAGGLLKG